MIIGVEHRVSPITRICEAVSNFYYKHHKEIYICSVCGKMEAPFAVNSYNSLTNEFGWVRKKNPSRWVCHHCDAHINDGSYTEEEWNEYVQEHNKQIKKICGSENTKATR